MTSFTEEVQPIWSVSGLAEVLAGPAAGEQADEIVQFNRNGRPKRTRGPTPSVMRTFAAWISGAMSSFPMSET